MGVYLGLPERICGSKKQVFAFIQDRLQNRINSWSAKLLSKGGNEVLIKSVAQALPTYVMSCFLLPQEIIRKITSAISRFWWSTKNNNRGLQWIAWNKICTQNRREAWDFEILKTSILHYLRSNSGDSYITQTHSWHVFLREDTTASQTRSRLLKQSIPPMFGGVSWRLCPYLKMAFANRSGWETTPWFGLTHGYHHARHAHPYYVAHLLTHRSALSNY